MSYVELLPPDQAVHGNAEWLKLRRAGISASEIAAVLGISPWQSPFSLWWAKAEGWGDEDNAEMSAGRRAEPVIADWFADEHPEYVTKLAGLYASAERSWMLATPDRLVLAHLDDGTGPCPADRTCVCYWIDEPPVALLECKYLVGGWDGWGEPGTDDVPVHYRAQCLWQADVLDVEQVYLAAWHGAEFRCYVVRRDEKDLRVMRAAGEEFMARLAAGDPPPIDDHIATVAALKRIHPDVEDRVAEVDWSTAAGYRRARALKTRAERLLTGFEARLRHQMGNARTAAHDGQRVATRVIADVAESTRTVAAHRRDYLLAPRGKK